jgi:hypothetical protein
VPVDIKKFITTQNKVGGVARPSHFAVELNHKGMTAERQEDMMFLCEAATIPGTRIATDDTHAPHGYGIVKKVPWNLMQDGTLNLMFMGDNSGVVYQQLTAAMMGVVKHNTKTLATNSYTVNYPVDYVHDLNIYTYDPKGRGTTIHTFIDAYISSIGSLSMSANDTGYVRIPVSFNYTRMITGTYTDSKMNAGSMGAGGFFSDRLDTDRPGILGRIQNELGERLDRGVNDVLNRLQQQVPPELQNVYARALPLLGGLNNFKF